MSTLKEKIYKYRRWITYCFIAISFILISVEYVQYISIAKSTVPIMDYWDWIAKYGQGVLDGTVSFKDFFFSDNGNHIQPFLMMLQFGVLKVAHFDVVPLVTWGVVIRLVIAALLVAAFLWRFKDLSADHSVLTVIFSVLMILSVLNYNQWELTTEPFSLTNGARILMYFLSFWWIDRFVCDFSKRTNRQNLIHGILLGCYCAFLTIFVSAAYFVGHLPAIGIVLLIVLYRNRAIWKKYITPFAMWCIVSFIGAVVYYVLISVGNRDFSGSSGGSENFLVLLLEGIVFFWGALFLPQAYLDTYGAAPFCIIGTAVIIYAVYVTYKYIRSDAFERNVMPVICVLYSFIAGVMITMGRVGDYGAQTMISSRYVVESSIGLVGIIWITYSLYTSAPKKKLSWVKPLSVAAMILFLFSVSIKTEMQIAPYRKMYYDGIAEMMVNIDDYKDDELGAFQANEADDIRYCVKFFKDNNLSIFRDKQS